MELSGDTNENLMYNSLESLTNSDENDVTNICNINEEFVIKNVRKNKIINRQSKTAPSSINYVEIIRNNIKSNNKGEIKTKNNNKESNKKNNNNSNNNDSKNNNLKNNDSKNETIFKIEI